MTRRRMGSTTNRGGTVAVQMLLGHASIQTTGDVYSGWSDDQLYTTMAHVLGVEDEEAQ